MANFRCAPLVTLTDTDVVISANRTTGTAPASVFFEAAVTSRRPGIEEGWKDCDIKWDFGVDNTAERLPTPFPWDKNTRTAYGHVAAFVFPAGTYTVTCEVYDGVSTVTRTMQVVIDDFATEYPTATHTIGTGGDYSSFAEAYAVHAGDAQQRYLFRRGETFNETLLINAGGPSVLQFGAWGSGSDPVLLSDYRDPDALRITANVGACETAISDIEITKTGWDPTLAAPSLDLPTGKGINFTSVDGQPEFEAWVAGTGSLDAWTESPKTIQNVKTNYCAISIFFNAQRFVHMDNVEVSGWYDYGTQAGDSANVAYTGCTLMQINNAINGNEAKYAAPWYPEHGPIRLSRVYGPTIMSRMRLRSRTSWASTSHGAQSNFRWATSCPIGTKGHFDMMVSEGGSWIYGNAATGAKTNIQAIWDRNIIFSYTHEAPTFYHGGAVVRNTLFVLPPTRSITQTGVQDNQPGFNGAAPWADGLTDATAAVTELYSSSWLDFRTHVGSGGRNCFVAGNLPGDGRANTKRRAYTGLSDGSAGARPVEIVNNIGIAPNRSRDGGSDYTAFNPLDLSAVLDFQFEGERYNGNGTTYENADPEIPETDFAYDPADIPMYGIPLAGSPAIGTATTGKVSKRDFFEQLRHETTAGLTRATFTQGPFEPNLEN